MEREIWKERLYLVLLCTAVVVLMLYGFRLYDEGEADESARQYLQKINGSYLANFDFDAIMNETRGLQEEDKEKLRKDFIRYEKTLGSFKENVRVSGKTRIEKNKQDSRKMIYGGYLIHNRYAKGDLYFRLYIVKVQNKWIRKDISGWTIYNAEIAER